METQYFYTTAYNKDQQTFVISSQFHNRLDAKCDIEDQIANRGLQYDGMIYPTQHKRDSGDTMTKFFKIRKQRRAAGIKESYNF